MRIHFTVFAAFVLTASPSHSLASPEQEGREFFQRYVALGDAYDPALADLYADDAVIRTFRRYPHGLERAMEVPGTQWKELIRKVMPLAKAQNDRSDYAQPTVESVGSRIKVAARRYSLRKCYWDPNYYLVLARQPGGALRIVEEYSETQPQSNC